VRAKKEHIEDKLKRLRQKQKVLDEAWQKTGNRELLQYFVDIIPKLLDAERCSIFILDPKTEEMWLNCGTGLDEREVKVPADNSLVGEVIATGRYQLRSHVDQTTGTHSMVDNQTGFITRNVVCVPIFNMAADKVVGALQVLNKKGGDGRVMGTLMFPETIGKGEFGTEDVEMLERTAFHLQMYIESIFSRQEIIRVSEMMDDKIKKLEGLLIRQELRERHEKENERREGNV
jgi:GAF domain-containing protein